MSESKSNINKIKELCSQLNNRDIQLKVNEKALWVMVERIERVESITSNAIKNKESLCKNSLEEKLTEISASLKSALQVISEKGCKKVE